MTPRPLATVSARAIVIAVGLALLVGCGLQPSRRLVEPVGPVLSGNIARPVAAVAVQEAAPAPVALGTLDVRAANITFTERSLTVGEPGLYTIELLNADSVAHEVLFDDGTRLAAAPGEQVSALVTIPAAGSAFVCTFPAHRDAGMVGQILVEP